MSYSLLDRMAAWMPGRREPRPSSREDVQEERFQEERFGCVVLRETAEASFQLVGRHRRSYGGWGYVLAALYAAGVLLYLAEREPAALHAAGLVILVTGGLFVARRFGQDIRAQPVTVAVDDEGAALHVRCGGRRRHYPLSVVEGFQYEGMVRTPLASAPVYEGRLFVTLSDRPREGEAGEGGPLFCVTRTCARGVRPGQLNAEGQRLAERMREMIAAVGPLRPPLRDRAQETT